MTDNSNRCSTKPAYLQPLWNIQ